MKTIDPRFALIDIIGGLLLAWGVFSIGTQFGLAAMLWSLGAFFSNHLVGAIAFTWADDESQALDKWVNAAPCMLLQIAALQAWPLVLWLRRNRKR